MFYCNKCGKERGWPTDTLVRSYGPCEICGKSRECNDIPCSRLPLPKEPRKEKKKKKR